MHPFTPPARLPSLPTPITPKEKKGSYFAIPQKFDAHLSEDELQQLTRSSFESQRPIFSRTSSKDRHTASRSSGYSYDKLYGRSGSISSVRPNSASWTNLTGPDLMQASYSSSATLHHPQPKRKISQCLTHGHLHLPADSCAVSDNSGSPGSNPRGSELSDSNDGPSAPAPTSNPVGNEQRLSGADLQLPRDDFPASVGHLIGADLTPSGAEHHLTGSDLELPPDEIPASVGHLIGADLKLKLPVNDGPPTQLPHPIFPDTNAALEKAASVAALLLERMDTHSPIHIVLTVDDSMAPTPPPLPTRKESVEIAYDSFEIVTTRTVSYKAATPPDVVALTSTLDGQGDSSSHPNWPLPARTPVYTFLPPPASPSPISSSLDASIPSDIPSPVGSPITTRYEPYIPRTLTSVVAELSASPRSTSPAVKSTSPPPRTLTSVMSEFSATQQLAAYSMIPPPYEAAISTAPYNRPLSSTPNSMVTSNQDYQPAFSPPPTSPDPDNHPSAMPSSMASHYRESSEVAAAREAYDEPAGSKQHAMGPSDQDSTAGEPQSAISEQSRARLLMPGRFPTGDSIRTIVHNPPTSKDQSETSSMATLIAPDSEPVADLNPYNTLQSQADPDAVAAARTAYIHPAFSKTSSTAPYNQGHEPDLSPIQSSMAQYHQPSAMPSSMASHYRESSAVAVAKKAYDEPPGSSRDSVEPSNQPAAMPSHMASHYRESSAVAAVKDAYDQPAGLMRSSFSPANQPAAMPSHMASHYRESSAVAKARVMYDEPHHQAQPATSAFSEAIAGFNNAFNRQSPVRKPVEISAFQNTQVQSPTPRISVPVHGSTPNQLTKPQPTVINDAALDKQPPFRHTSQLNHSPNSNPNAIMNAQPLPAQVPQYKEGPAPTVYQIQRPPIDRQLPAIAPSLHIQTVRSFRQEPSFWRRRRKILSILLVIVLIGIGVGIVFIAQSFYKQWGGVGFLGTNVHTGNDGQWDGKYARRNLVGLEHEDESRKTGRKTEKGLVEGMLMGAYKRGLGTAFKDGQFQSRSSFRICC